MLLRFFLGIGILVSDSSPDDADDDADDARELPSSDGKGESLTLEPGMICDEEVLLIFFRNGNASCLLLLMVPMMRL